jgi:hypothetical protein
MRDVPCKSPVAETVKKEGYPATFDGVVYCPNNKERYTSHFSNSVGVFSALGKAILHVALI